MPTFIPASALGREDGPPPSERITMGIVGWGMMAPDNTRGLMRLPDCQVVASCNIDKKHLKKSVDAINGHYKNKGCKTYHDYRKMMARKDIDAVMIAVPDHWHELIAVEAARHKKDIYGEKPLAKTIAEQQRIVQGGAGKRAHLADRFLAAFQRQFPQGGGNRPQRVDRQSHARGSGLALGPHGFRARRQTRPDHQAAARTGLQHVDRPFQDDALHQGAQPS